MPTKKNSQLVQYISSLRSSSSYIIAFILVLGSIRGLIVLNSELPAKTVYNITATLLIILSAYGFLKRVEFKNHDIVLLKKLLQINLLLGIVNVLFDLLLGIPFSPTVFYIYLLPYVVFLFLRVPTAYFNVAFTIITLVISYSVCDNFIESLKGSEGYQNVFDYNTKLRPDTFEALDRTGDFYCAAGYTGNNHDSANILGLTGSLFFIRYFVGGKWLDLGLSLFALFSLMLTQSATNIIVAIFTCVIFSVYVLVLRWKIRNVVSLLVAVAAILWLFASFGDFIKIFTARLGEDSNREAMLNQLNMGSLVSALPFFLIGHARAFGSEIIDTEIAHLKGVFQLGIVHASILYWILIYPILRFVKVRSFCSAALPGVAAIFFGFMSLIHYGSLLRSTNVLLFYAIYTTCLAYIINCNESNRLLGIESRVRGLDVRSSLAKLQ